MYTVPRIIKLFKREMFIDAAYTLLALYSLPRYIGSFASLWVLLKKHLCYEKIYGYDLYRLHVLFLHCITKKS